MLYSQSMTIRALIFDFDGLILDTETPEVEVWKAIYAEHGFEYSQEHWSQTIGGWGISNFDPAEELYQRSDQKLDREALRRRGREESDALIWRGPVREGVRECIAAARRLGLRLAIASSSERAWVEPHLARLGLLDSFDKVICGDDVPAGRTKPHPDVFKKALAELQIRADEAIVLEDSPHGVKAAHAAGIFVVAVPNPVTAILSLDEADLVVDSLAKLSLDGLLKRAEGLGRPEAGPQPLS
jgi:HAD superfamily hydrolase (TIGR01509 family)